MSKYVTIKEGGIGRKFNTSFLKTANQSSGSSEWMPEDEAELEEKYISENGHYDPAKYAFSKVTVNIYDYTMGYIQGFDIDSMEFKIISVDPITIELIEMVLPEGFPQIDTTPFVIGDLELSTVNLETGEFFNIEFPEEFQSLLDDLKLNNVEGVIGYDYTQEEYIISMPDVDGGITTTPFGYTPIDVNGNPIAPQDIGNYDMGDGYVIGIDGLGEYGIATQDSLGNINITNLNLQLNSFRFDANSMISGFDANGNAVEVTLGDDGSVAVTNLPSSIEIITQPTKTVYEDGETIDITGMVVVAKNADGTTWTSAQYPNGHIPLQEISISETTATKTGTKSSTYVGGSGGLTKVSVVHDFHVSGSRDLLYEYRSAYGRSKYLDFHQTASLYGKLGFPRVRTNNISIWLISDTENGISGKREFNAYGKNGNYDPPRSEDSHGVTYYPDPVNPVTSYTKNGKTVYTCLAGGLNYSSGAWSSGDYYKHEEYSYTLWDDNNENTIPDGLVGESGDGSVALRHAWEYFYGNTTVKIPISWKRPIDNTVLDTAFEITVSQSEV